MGSVLPGVAFSTYQAAQLKLPRQACKGSFLIGRVPPVKNMPTGKFKTNGESTATRNAVSLRGPIQKNHSLVLLTLQSKQAGAQKPWMHG